MEAFKDALKGYDTSEGTIRFTPDKPLPEALVRRLVREKVRINAAKAGRAPIRVSAG